MISSKIRTGSLARVTLFSSTSTSLGANAASTMACSCEYFFSSCTAIGACSNNLPTSTHPLESLIACRIMERETGLEPATNSLEGCDSTTELLPQNQGVGNRH